MELIYLLKEIFIDRAKALLAIIAIAWGTFAISIMLAVGQGFLLSLTSFMQQMGSHLIIAEAGSSTIAAHGNLSGVPTNFTIEDIEALKHLTTVKRLSAEYSTLGELSKTPNTSFTAISGVDQNYLRLHQVAIAKGRFINQDDIKKSRNVIVLGDQISKVLFENANPLEQWIKLGPFILQVIGITVSDASQFNLYESSNSMLAWIPDSTFKSFYPDQTPHYMLVDFDNSQTEKNQKMMTAIIARLHHLDPNDQGIMSYYSNQQALKTIRNFFRGLQWFLGALGGITLLIAGFSIANIMLLAVRRAIPLIGLRMALGAQPYQIAKNYLIEALVLSLSGGILGLLFTLLILKLINFILLRVHLFNLITLHLTLSLSLVSLIILILTLVGLCTGFFPALQAARIQPIEALRHE